MKKSAALMCAVLMLFVSSLSSCGKAGAVKVGGADVSAEVFIYYINRALDELPEDASEDDVFARAVEYVRYYVKTNTLASEQGMKLNISKRAAVAELTNNTYAVFGSFYGAIGVSKQTLTKIFTSEAYEQAFLDFFYGINGVYPASQDELLSCFNRNFVVFKSVNGYYTKTNYSGETVNLTSAERDALVLRFKSAAGKLNSGDKTFEQVLGELSDTFSSGSNDITVIRSDSEEYPDGFFEEAVLADTGEALVVETDSCAFLVQKIPVTTDSVYFTENYDYVLSQLKGGELEALLASQKTYAVEYMRPQAVLFYNSITAERSRLDEYHGK